MSYSYWYGFCAEDGHELLIQLIKQNDARRLTTLLEDKSEYDITDAHLYHALNKTVLDGNHDLVKLFIQNGAPVMESSIVTKSGVKSLDKPDCSPMVGAIFRDSPDILATLIRHGGSVNQTYKEIKDRTLAMQCVIWNKPECLSVLIDHGADVHKYCLGVKPRRSVFEGQSAAETLQLIRTRSLLSIEVDDFGTDEFNDDDDVESELLRLRMQRFGGPIQTPTIAAACLGHLDVLKVCIIWGV